MKILKILLYIALVVMLQSCGLTKKVFKTTTQTQTEKTDVKKDSTTIVEVSKPIKDQIVVNVPKSDNEAVNKALDAILKQLNTSKSSGSNSYVSRYDAENNRILIEYLIGQTKNQQTTTNTDIKTEKTFEEKTDEYIKTKIKVIPIWVYVLVILFFRKQIFGFIVELFPQLKTVKWLVRLIT